MTALSTTDMNSSIPNRLVCSKLSPADLFKMEGSLNTSVRGSLEQAGQLRMLEFMSDA